MRDRVVDTTVRLTFNTNDADGAPVAPSSAFAASDFAIYKDGSATQKTTTDGITVTSPFDSVVGLHLIEIDTSNDTNAAGFWVAGSEYRVAVSSAKTVDGVSQSGVIVGEFRLVTGTVELDSSVTDQLDDIEGDTTATLSALSSISAAISAIAAIFSGMTSLPNWLRRAWRKDAGTGGMSTAQTEINTGGTATFAGTTDSQEAIKDAIGSSGGGPAYSAAVVAARLPVGAAAGWPQEIVCGSAYLTELGTHVPLYVKDVDENILAAMGDKTFADGDFKAILRLSPLTDANKLLAQPAATIEVDSDDTPGIVFNDDTAEEEYFELQIPKAKTVLGEIRTRYLCQVILRWGDGSEYEWIVNLGESKFIRGIAAAT